MRLTSTPPVEREFTLTVTEAELKRIERALWIAERAGDTNTVIDGDTIRADVLTEKTRNALGDLMEDNNVNTCNGDFTIDD